MTKRLPARLATAAAVAFASLTIHPALAGDDNVAILDGGVKVEQVEEELCALDIAPAEKQAGETSPPALPSQVPARAQPQREARCGEAVDQVPQPR